VLVVDDQPEFVRAVRRLLLAKGYLVEVAPSGEEGARLIAQVPEMFDVVVTDIAMPGVDGIDLLQQVQARDSSVPVVLITGAPALGTAVKALQHRAFQYLTKPVTLSILEATIDDAIETRRGQRLALPTQNLGMRFDSAMQSLWVAYQPIVHSGSDHLFGFEALLRTDEPTLADPGSVLDAAERLGRLDEVGRRIRRHSASALRSAREPACLFVNVHTADLLDPTLLDHDSPLAKLAHRVVLEITERASVESIPDVQGRVARLREMGYRIALDDMGAGYANLNAFALLEPDVVKLDMSLVRDVHKTKIKQKLVRAIATLCRDMDVLVVGEGVETVEERDALVSLGCDLLQGFLFCRPQPSLPSASLASSALASSALASSALASSALASSNRPTTSDSEAPHSAAPPTVPPPSAPPLTVRSTTIPPLNKR
jgi:EAL domain-containing protein (putative c-di-GMP-specific phosphodiesterase class I)